MIRFSPSGHRNEGDRVRGFWVAWKGLRSVFDHLFQFLVASCTWYVAVLLIVGGPAATLALFRITDPRWGFGEDPPTWRESAEYVWRNLWRGWTLALLTAPVLLLCLFNIGFYAEESGSFGILVPLWVFLLVAGSAITLIAFSIAALEGKPTSAALRLAAKLTFARLPRVLLTLVLVVLLGLFSVVLTPFLLLYPAVVASIVNRLILDALRIPIPDPSAPTPERELERARRGLR
jgi:hypothetical protein